MEWLTGFGGFIVGLVLGAAGGYLACLFWGKPARELKKLTEKTMGKMR